MTTALLTPAEITPDTAPADVFEKGEPCWKCSGTGRIRGFSHVMGGVCFRCGGVGTPLSKRGAEARRYFKALGETSAAGLSIGDLIYDNGTPGIVAGGWRTVRELVDVTAEPAKAGSCSLYRKDDLDKIEAAVERGATILPDEHDASRVRVYEGIMVVCDKLTTTMVAKSRVRVSDHATQVARLKAAAEYQLALTKSGKPRKGSRYDRQEVAA
jgi:hypothetical protein